MNVTFTQSASGNRWEVRKADKPHAGDVVGLITKMEDGVFAYMEAWRKGFRHDRVDTLDIAQRHFLEVDYQP